MQQLELTLEVSELVEAIESGESGKLTEVVNTWQEKLNTKLYYEKNELGALVVNPRNGKKPVGVFVNNLPHPYQSQGKVRHGGNVAAVILHGYQNIPVYTNSKTVEVSNNKVIVK